MYFGLKGHHVRTFFFVFLASLFLFIAASVPYLFSESEDALKSLQRSIDRFAEVSPGAYRSGLIHEEDAPYLKDLGIKTVVNLDDDSERAKKEEQFLRPFGIYMIWLPWNGLDSPKDEVIDKSLALLNTPDLRPILIHCERGSERTGLTVGCWRIAQQNWTAKQAYEEMKSYDFRPFWYGHLKKYLFRFARSHGDSRARIGNWFEKMKTNTLSFFYRFRNINLLFSCPACAGRSTSHA